MPCSATKLNAIYCKTATGENEIATRQHGLLSKQRQALILIDGKKSYAQLNQLLPTIELDQLIHQLLQLDLIRDANATPLLAPQNPAANHVICITESSAKATAIPLDIERLNAIKQLMIDSSKTLLGIFANTLIEKIKSIEDAAQLSPAIAQWNLSLRESKNGQLHAEQYLEAIKSLMK
ncbi:hypothetical protein HQN60_09545 [Deefgea piscis]|uniref:Uncharacterized protein n=1 Tax=Deefgea piscis TaxID=2739061 RepID=A0A6M8SW98_9NEIS|nr:hypothetical protein [Deefgea piscis]QKJ66919.1 hypothetical protein HQN60_09545 [Deefgea piscis]